LAAWEVWALWAERRLRAGPDAPALPPAEHAVAAGHAVAPPRAEPGEPVAQAAAAVLPPAASVEVAVPRLAEPGEAAVLRVEAAAVRAAVAARLREAGADAAAPPQAVRAAVALLWAAAWVFRRDRLRLVVRRRSAPSAQAMRSLRTASPQ
jgi:hypothetical protein